MAKAAKKKKGNGKTPDTPPEPELSPREQERKDLIEKQAHPDKLQDLWDGMADQIEAHSKGLKEVMSHSITGALAMGAKIVEFCKAPEIQLQIQLANLDKRGQDWKDYNYAAKQLATVYKGLPSEKHMGDCARAYVKADETGQLGDKKLSLRKLLGWTPSAVPALTGKGFGDDANPTLPKDKKDPPPPPPPPSIDPRADLVTAIHNANETIQHLVDKCREKDMSLKVQPVQMKLTELMETLETIQ